MQSLNKILKTKMRVGLLEVLCGWIQQQKNNLSPVQRPIIAYSTDSPPTKKKSRKRLGCRTLSSETS